MQFTISLKKKGKVKYSETEMTLPFVWVTSGGEDTSSDRERQSWQGGIEKKEVFKIMKVIWFFTSL